MAMTQPTLLEDLIVEILSWLLVESLKRFRVVSKAWNSLIFDLKLVKLHLQRSFKDTHVLLRSICFLGNSNSNLSFAACSVLALLQNPSSTLDDASQQLHHNYIFASTCNGLICLLDYHFDGHKFGDYWVCFWNLSTGIRSQDSPRFSFHSCSYQIGVDCMKCEFGYDDLSNTYMAMLLLSDTKSENWEVKVHFVLISFNSLFSLV